MREHQQWERTPAVREPASKRAHISLEVPIESALRWLLGKWAHCLPSAARLTVKEQIKQTVKIIQLEWVMLNKYCLTDPSQIHPHKSSIFFSLSTFLKFEEPQRNLGNAFPASSDNLVPKSLLKVKWMITADWDNLWRERRFYRNSILHPKTKKPWRSAILGP